MLLIPLVNLMYVPLNHNNGHVHSLVTALDKSIPFGKFFVVPYAAWYLFIFAILVWFMLKDHDLYFAAIISIITGLLISFFIFSVFQTAVPRPVISSQDFFSRLTGLIYHLDAPYNDFPSIHVMTSFIIFIGSERAKIYSQKIPLLAQGMAVLVILSTLFLKQHTLLDVAGGVVLGGTVFTLSYRAASFLKYIETGSPGGVRRGKKLPASLPANELLYNTYLFIPAIFYILKEITIICVDKWFQSGPL